MPCSVCRREVLFASVAREWAPEVYWRGFFLAASGVVHQKFSMVWLTGTRVSQIRACSHYWDGGDGSQFFRVLGARSVLWSITGATSDNEIGKTGPVPSGCGGNSAILRCRPRRWGLPQLSAVASSPTPRTKTYPWGPRRGRISARNAIHPNSGNRP